METPELNFKQRFINAQQEIKKVDKDGKNPHYKSDYATLPAVLGLIRPILHEHGLFYRTMVKGTTLITYVEDQHSNEHYSTEMQLLEVSNMQKLGSSLTYAQRYSLLLIMGIAAGMDDDGNAASLPDKKEDVKINKEPKKKALDAPAPNAATRVATNQEIDIITNLMAKSTNEKLLKWIKDFKILNSAQLLNFWGDLIGRLEECVNESA